ncbi:hypothetical protein MKW94_028021 [Papaver nudicaule]|uniref:Protein kinase domain-containing protein n=1 Tax=Papaver nudicaule TaxID=74823 RepID=A0AA41RY04_PAPNU|nr:hypothetical protein [Papaver nudicaule]
MILLIAIIIALNSIELASSLDQRFADCKPKHCGNGLFISYPFWIENDYCGYPGFQVTCKNNEPILYAAGYDYIIRDISYANRSFLVVNPVAYNAACPVPFRNSTFTDQSPFTTGSGVQTLSFFYNCTNFSHTLYDKYIYPVNTSCVTFLPDPKHFSFAGFVPAGKSVYDMLTCQTPVNIPVEEDSSLRTLGQVNGYLPLLTKGFTLEWNKPPCSDCEASGGYCGIDENGLVVFSTSSRVIRIILKIIIRHLIFSPNIKLVVEDHYYGRIVVGLGIGLATFICLKKRSTSRNFNADMENWDMSMEEEFQKGKGPKRFSYNELGNATGNFDERRKLGQGGFGGVYKGSLVRCKNKGLSKHPFQGENVLAWEVRYKITLGLASALLYLHEEWEQCVVHRDIKSSNIMLDSDFNAKLGDFGLARLVDHGKGSETTAVAGTRGYLAPECYITGKFSKESDIYSFGIVALEIACGRKPAEIGKLDLVEWVWGLYGSGKLAEAADERLNMEFNELQMKHLMVVGLWCAHPDYKSRPSITQVINVLKFESPLPVLPLELPTPVYLSALPAIPDLLSVGGLTNTLNGR